VLQFTDGYLQFGGAFGDGLFKLCRMVGQVGPAPVAMIPRFCWMEG
jgi:hypothetical protein